MSEAANEKNMSTLALDEVADQVNTVNSSVEDVDMTSEGDVETKSSEVEPTFRKPVAVRTCMPPPVSVAQKYSDVTVVESETAEKLKPESTGTIKIKSAPPLSYKMPTWSGVVTGDYRFEVLKSGTIVGNVDLKEKCYIVFGRLECCDVVMEHPSISRYHTVVQYRAESDEHHPSGLYVYDLDSTHGTFLNKEQIRARTYYRMQVGHMLKLGGSSRVFLLQGPSEDQEDELELTVTQLKELRRREELEKKIAEEQKKIEAKKKEEEGIDWGFGEDAVEDQLTENPFALSTPNEDLYLDDPKKSLRGWFEREGYDLEYQVEEKGFGHFSCKIMLPVDTAETLYAEASVKGKKKEAVALCALEACRILDRYGLLRQSHHEGRKRKHKNWEEDDFYDSDEDTFLDRTGTIEKKREMRKKLLNNEVETYDSLIKKLDVVEDEIEEIQKKLEAATRKSDETRNESRDQDSLEVYMSAIQSGDEMDKKTKSNLRLRLSVLNQERTRLQKLANLAQPTRLPPLIRNVAAEGKKMVMIGSMKGGKKRTRMVSSALKRQLPSVGHITIDLSGKDGQDDVQEVEEEEEDTEHKEETKGEKPNVDNPEPTSSDKTPTMPADLKQMNEADKRTMEKAEETTTSTSEEKCVVEKSSETGDSAKIVGPTWNPEDGLPKKRGKKRSGQKSRKDIYDGTNPDYAMWLPPDGQTGDGKTFLNDKFGY